MFGIYLTALAVAIAGSFLFVPLSIRLAEKSGAMDFPDERKVHTKPIARWGGLGIALSFFLALIAVYFFFPRFHSLLAYKHKIMSGREMIGILSLKKQFWGVLFGSVFILGLGMWDDKKRISAAVKLPLQIIAAYIAMDYGVRLFGITLPWKGGYFLFPEIASQIATIFWLTGFMNTVNLMDGLDGLAAGICAIAAGTFLVVAVLQGQTHVALFSKQLKLAGVLSAALCGSCIGFLWYNFFPAKVFMGDGGALFLGYMLACITVIGTLKTSAFFSLIIPIVVVALPVMDVAVSILRRLRSGKEVFEADKGHLHHQLLRHGWSQREAVLGMYVVTLVLSLFSIILTVFKGKV
jgi:UDP-GlcNAc:undecaprenyl-phosphate GlcNAc-1-phosphate transferase